jgi:8-oxo-dGTP pyrophosphatase MutT (NUDIX family)
MPKDRSEARASGRITGSTFELACGGLVWRDDAPGPSPGPPARRVLVVHRERYDDWSLPKGKFEPGVDATVVDCALREVLEETGVRARALGFAGQTMYLKSGKPKLVLFWTMAMEDAGAFEPNDEISGVEWLGATEAAARLSHVDERRLVAEHARR